VLKNCVASVIYHADWIRKNTSPDYGLFSTPLFSAFNVDDLKRRVVCEVAKPNSVVQPTGVSAYVSTKLQVDHLQSKQDEILNAIADFKETLDQNLRRGLNDFAVSQGHLTLDVFRTLLDEKFGAIRDDVVGARSANVAEPDGGDSEREQQDEVQVHS
jgi:hypothetical protein